jgi:hypothetical protein
MKNSKRGRKKRLRRKRAMAAWSFLGTIIHG